MTPVLDFAKRHDIEVLEDCAQAFTGPDWTGTPGCLASMFSFGTIKTSTALGGALVTIRDPELANAVIREHDNWPVQRRLSFASRFARACLMKLLAYRPMFFAFRLTLSLCRRNFDHVLNNFARGFPGADLVPQIERRPCTPLLALMCRRLLRFDSETLARRTAIGERLRCATRPAAALLGHQGDNHTFWVFPVLSHDPQSLISRLRHEGFDATQGASMEIIVPPDGRADTATTIRTAFDRIVYLPLSSPFPTRKSNAWAAWSASRKPEAGDCPTYFFFLPAAFFPAGLTTNHRNSERSVRRGIGAVATATGTFSPSTRPKIRNVPPTALPSGLR
ncbi:MAG: hypothetical protein CM1200mP2_24990 [Planctomycetaceae bacterium]|nr:MAG: hypothetical protein CM1200mP2_24990 [Planctomycetaceae bacterium]